MRIRGLPSDRFPNSIDFACGLDLLALAYNFSNFVFELRYDVRAASCVFLDVLPYPAEFRRLVQTRDQASFGRLLLKLSYHRVDSM